MADPILHIKDGYFFEVPKALWRHHWTKIDQVPVWLRHNHEDVSIETWNKAMDGKILIPQPFGTPTNLNQPGTGFCISRYMILETVVAIILAAVFIRLAQKIRSGGVARGSLWNFAEGLLEYLRDQVAKPAIGEHDADRFVPLLWTIFLFILGCNLMGMLPWAGSPTAAFGATMAMAGVTFITVLVSGMVRFGPVGYWLNQVPGIDVAAPIRYPLQVFIFGIEFFGLLVRHGVLAIRLLANMVAGHLVLLAILGVILTAAHLGTGPWSIAAVIAVIGSALLSILELFVAFLQAYVFTFLSALFIGAAIHHH